MRPPALPLALAVAVAAGACGGGGPRVGAQAVLRAGDAGAARVLSFSSGGAVVGVAAEPPALDAPVRALAARADRSFVVLQDVSGGAAPGVLVAPDGTRVAALAAVDGGGRALFDAAAPPWAAAEAADGRIWVTGRAAPVLYEPDGTLARVAAPVPVGTTRGVAALADGRVLVTFPTSHAALYPADGGAPELLSVDVGAAYSEVDAIAVRPDGGIVVAIVRHGVTSDGVLVDVALGPGTLAGVGDPEAAARLPELPSAIDASGDPVLAGPSLGSLAAPACAEALSPDLRERRGCVGPGNHRGVLRIH